MRRYWTCPKCAGRWERSLVKCRTEGCTGRRPKRRVPAHARTLRDDSYLVYEALNEEIHGPAFPGAWGPDCCGVCGKPPTTVRHMDRDHDHLTGLPRGLACPGNQGCNALMPRQLTLERARLIVGYLERVEAYYAKGGDVGLILDAHGRITIEKRRESFIIHPSYGYDAEGNEHSDDLGTFGIEWRERPHPEFLLTDLANLLDALNALLVEAYYLHGVTP